MLRPTAFMDIWIDQILAKGIREKGVATIFGDGKSPTTSPWTMWRSSR